jgi:hypothetical protein
MRGPYTGKAAERKKIEGKIDYLDKFKTDGKIEYLFLKEAYQQFDALCLAYWRDPRRRKIKEGEKMYWQARLIPRKEGE